MKRTECATALRNIAKLVTEGLRPDISESLLAAIIRKVQDEPWPGETDAATKIEESLVLIRSDTRFNDETDVGANLAAAENYLVEALLEIRNEVDET